MSFEDFQRLAATGERIVELLSEPVGVADIELEIPHTADPARPAEFN
jgi:hypothetical protein